MTAASTPTNSKLIIIGIGASAGGLEALRELLPALPLNQRVVYVLAQHLDPKHSSMLVSILSRDSTVPVTEAKNGEHLAGGHLYVVPPGMDAWYANGRVHLEKALGIGPKPSIDRFFFSLSENHGSHSIGIILSGTGTDGAHGIRAIKAEGGITIAQQQATAKFDSMPLAAISTGQVDLELAPLDIAHQITDFIDQPGETLDLKLEPVTDNHTDLGEILALVLAQTGSDFSDYKQKTLLRRIERRMTVHKLKSLEEYTHYLNEKPEELYELHNDILISVTSFFRDQAAFQVLSNHVSHLIPNDTTKELRIWVAGCATGEEAYTVAILLAEHLGQRLHHYKVQIFGTDLYEGVLTIARQGIYPKTAIAEVPEKLITKYFIQKEGAYQLNNQIRSMVVFARHNLVSDPPFSNLNLITCRNVLIYFNAQLQKNVLELFHYALRPGGLLFLGKSETVGSSESLFATLDRQTRLYRHRDEIKSRLPYGVSHRAVQSINRQNRESTPKTRLKDVLDKLIADIYQPRCILLNEHGDVSYLYGDVSPFLSFPEGQLGTHLLDLINANLRNEIRALLYKARHSENSVISRPLHHTVYGEEHHIRVRVHYYPAGRFSNDELTLIIFETVQQPRIIHSSHSHIDKAAQTQIISLEEELRETRESLQTTIEELETSNEELQSTYEEAQSTNEELYTTTEELQTSNEELQSTNEELRTVNQELNVKSTELEETNQKLQQTNAQLTTIITEHQHTQKHLQEERRKFATVFEVQPTWVSICDNQSTILEINPAGIAIMEAPSATALVGRRLAEFAHADHRQSLAALFTTLQNEDYARQDNIEIKTLKGNKRILELNAALLNNTPGQERILNIISDQTERNRSQNALIERQKELAHVMRLNTLGEMASGLAHELNQPLSALANYIHGCQHRMQRKECSFTDLEDVLALMSEQIQRASSILRHVKNFTRKNHDNDYQEAHINDIIKRTVALLQTTGQFGRVNFTVELDDNLPLININVVQIEQVLINLLKNAVDATCNNAQQTDHIAVRIRTHLEDSHTIQVQVIDKGPGIKDSLLTQIFQPFFTTKKDGMGMGLAISHSIVEEHGGKLECHNNLNGGATFSFSLSKS